jgi:hypothetical protein
MDDDVGMDARVARDLWHRLEAINAVTYFAPECRDAPERLGLAGFWMGYFGCRAAPLGLVGTGVVEATFFNFHPDRVRRAIPEAWDRAEPAAIIAARADAAATALRRLLGGSDAERLAQEVLGPLARSIERAPSAGRPLFAANCDVANPSDAVAALWQAATTLREHRGDGHVALLTAAGLDGCEAHALFASCEGTDPELYLRSRGWSADDWAAAIERLATRGLVTGDGVATPVGRDLREEIERRTDELAVDAYEQLGEPGVTRLLDALTPPASRIATSGEIMFPNPMGLPALPAEN